MPVASRNSILQQDPLGDWEADNHELDRRFLAALGRKDVEGAVSCFLNSTDLTVVLWGREIRGTDQFRDALTAFLNIYDEVKLEIDRVTRFPSGDGVIAIGQATYTLRKNGNTSRISEIWTDLRRKVQGRWVYVLDHAEVIPGKC